MSMASTIDTQQADGDLESAKANSPSWFSKSVFAMFYWIMLGICVIYGVRLWFNDPIHPSFIPIAGGAFAAALAFTLVLTFEYVTGPIKLKLGSIDFQGASGPIVLWCLCFIAIVTGLFMLGLADAVTEIPAAANSKPIHKLFQ